jgi:hypothetical protein
MNIFSHTAVLIFCLPVLAQAAPAEYKPTFEPFIWKSEAPADCPFENSHELTRIRFLGVHRSFPFGDTWYPSWAADNNLYSPWTDGSVAGQEANSDGWTEDLRGTIAPYNVQLRKADTSQAVMIGDDPMNLDVQAIGAPVQADPYPYGGRYPCGSLVYKGVWYYGTYCLSPNAVTRFGDKLYNWPWLGPFVGFRISTDLGKTWQETPHTPDNPLFEETGLWGYPVKIGTPHFVDFGKDMEHSPDGKAYLVAHGAVYPNPKPRFANLSWITGDQIYLLRVQPGIENLNDAGKYQFFAGNDPSGEPVWTNDFKRIKPLLEWNNNMGCVTVTYDAPLKKYLMCVVDGGNTCARMNTYILESDRLTGPWRMVTYMKSFGEQAYFVNFPSKFISADGHTAWLCYGANFAVNWNGEHVRSNPPSGGGGLRFQQVQLLGQEQP